MEAAGSCSPKPGFSTYVYWWLRLTQEPQLLSFLWAYLAGDALLVCHFQDLVLLGCCPDLKGKGFPKGKGFNLGLSPSRSIDRC